MDKDNLNQEQWQRRGRVLRPAVFTLFIGIAAAVSDMAASLLWASLAAVLVGELYDYTLYPRLSEHPWIQAAVNNAIHGVWASSVAAAMFISAERQRVGNVPGYLPAVCFLLIWVVMVIFNTRDDVLRREKRDAKFTDQISALRQKRYGRL